ncbi:MAG TPA: LacI family DNA-binding transcriptional regulator [Sinomonas sp.]|nr:LacI family DNA-binding transcriptional regulator [Sinomonas sp.]
MQMKGGGTTLADVAAHSGVSAKTVSRVVNNEPNVRAEVRELVMRSVKALGYRPNAAARALATQRTHQIGLITTASPLYGPTAGLFSLEQAAWKAGYSLTLSTIRSSSEAELADAISYLLGRGVEGILVSGAMGVLHMSRSALAGLPVVSTSPLSDDAPSHVVVDTDQVGGAAAAVRHLFELGHRRIAHIAGPLEWYAAAQRRDGWLLGMSEVGLKPGPVVEGDWSARSGYEAGKSLVSGNVTAVFVANDHMAMGAIRAFTEGGLNVPADVSIVGFDDVPEAEFQMVPLTTVRQDFAAAAERSVRELIQLVEGSTSEDSIVRLPTELVVRDSSQTPRPDISG